MATQLCPRSPAQDSSASSELPGCLDSQLIMRQGKGKAQSFPYHCPGAGKCLQRLKDSLSPPQLGARHMGTSASTPSLSPGHCRRGKSLFLLEHLLWVCSSIIISPASTNPCPCWGDPGRQWKWG